MNLTEKFLQFALLGVEWVLWLLVVLSVISVYVMLERWIFFRSVSGGDTKLRRRLMTTLADGELEEAARIVRDANGTGGRMVAEMLAVNGRGRSSLDAAMNAVRAEEKIRLEQHLSYLGTLGANAPFIGLFGTVLGIIQAFNDLAETGLRPGGEQSTAVMAGISEALVATAVGLLVAIPAVVAYNVFQRRVKRMLAEGEAIANGAFSYIVTADGADPYRRPSASQEEA
jgi:biopolymer transport protein ExbB